MASEYEKMIAGDYYRPADPELRALAKASREKQEAFNQEVDPKKGAAIIKEWFGSTGENLYLNRQVLVDYGVNIHLGENFYANRYRPARPRCREQAYVPADLQIA